MPFDGRKRLTPIADKARECLGPNGERWFRNGAGWTSGNSCIVQAVVRAIGLDNFNERMTPAQEEQWQQKYRPLLAKAVQGTFVNDIFKWNDAPERTFADIEAALARFADLEAEMNMEKVDAV